MDYKILAEKLLGCRPAERPLILLRLQRSGIPASDIACGIFDACDTSEDKLEMSDILADISVMLEAARLIIEADDVPNPPTTTKH